MHECRTHESHIDHEFVKTLLGYSYSKSLGSDGNSSMFSFILGVAQHIPDEVSCESLDHQQF